MPMKREEEDEEDEEEEEEEEDEDGGGGARVGGEERRKGVRGDGRRGEEISGARRWEERRGGQRRAEKGDDGRVRSQHARAFVVPRETRDGDARRGGDESAREKARHLPAPPPPAPRSPPPPRRARCCTCTTTAPTGMTLYVYNHCGSGMMDDDDGRRDGRSTMMRARTPKTNRPRRTRRLVASWRDRMRCRMLL